MKSNKNAFAVKTTIVNGNYGADALSQDVIANSIVLLRGSNKFLEILVPKDSFKDRKGIYFFEGDKEKHITTFICPVYYGLKCDSDCVLVECRHFAVTNLYQRWCEFNNNHNAKLFVF